jgi:hypothetical protein
MILVFALLILLAIAGCVAAIGLCFVNPRYLAWFALAVLAFVGVGLMGKDHPLLILPSLFLLFWFVVTPIAALVTIVKWLVSRPSPKASSVQSPLNLTQLER